MPLLSSIKNHRLLWAMLILPAGLAHAQPTPMSEYNPVMLNLATLFDFDALRGPVKTFETSMTDASDNTLFKAAGAFDQQGCIEHLKTEDAQNNINYNYKRVGNKLISQVNTQDFIPLNTECLPQSHTQSGSTMSFTYNDAKLISQINSQPNDTLVALHQYNTNQLLADVRFFISGVTISRSHVTYIDEKNKPYDYAFEQTDFNKPGFFIKRECKYDQYGNPTSCILTQSNDKDFKEVSWVHNVNYQVTWFGEHGSSE